MHALLLLTALILASTTYGAVRPASRRIVARGDPPRNSTGLTDSVQWDATSFWIEGQRIFLHSGEFHTFRLPVPDLWLDIFQKIAATGMNGVSVYIHWGLTNPAPGVLDFDDWRALQPMFDAAKQAGLFLVLRPGPYINAETTAGGLALWSTSLTSSTLRTNASDIEHAWMPYIRSVIKATVANQVSHGGPVMAVQIDNEYNGFPPGGAEYFAQLEQTYRENGIVVPLTYNDPGERMNFINGTGAPDIYGLDDYPQHFNCSTPTFWDPVQTNYHQYHEQVDPRNVFFMPEFQGGAHNPWGGPLPDDCFEMTNAQFQDVFYKNNWAANVKAINYYMFYGGTNHGGIGFEGVYTSYDYGGAVRENRALSTKFDELKRQGLFIRSSPEFRNTQWIGSSNASTGGLPPGTSTFSLHGNSPFVTVLRNPDTGAQFIVARQNDSTSTEPMAFKIRLPTSLGSITVPNKLSTGMELNGRQSKLILADYTFGGSESRNKLLYSTATILLSGTIGNTDVLFLYGDQDQSHEFAYYSEQNKKDVKTVTFTPSTFKGGLHVVSAPTAGKSAAPLVLFADTQTATTFFAPPVLGTSPSADVAKMFPTYFQFGTNSTVLIGGPYLVRNATLSANGRTLALNGDLNSTVPLTLVVPESVQSVSWNNQPVHVSSLSVPSAPRGITGVRLLRGELVFGTKGSKGIKVPKLAGWKFKDSLPEVLDSFDDSEWTIANHTTTNIPGARFGDGRVLYGCDYGFCENVMLWRGHFNGSGHETSVNLTIDGGSAFAASVWLNDQFLNSTDPGPSADHSNALYSFERAKVKVGVDNVITVLQDHTGNNETPDQRSARGIPGFLLNGGNFTTWKVQGKLGGYAAYPDKVRGLLNEGGLFGEREGWHLPGFDASSWDSRELASGLPENKAGVGFFVTTFDLDVPQGVDPTFAFVFDNGARTLLDQEYRAFLFVNGWKYGKRVSNIGPQTKYPVPPGILDVRGKNTIALAVWSLKNARVAPALQLVLDSVVEGGVGPVAINNPPWSPRSLVH